MLPISRPLPNPPIPLLASAALQVAYQSGATKLPKLSSFHFQQLGQGDWSPIGAINLYRPVPGGGFELMGMSMATLPGKPVV